MWQRKTSCALSWTVGHAKRDSFGGLAGLVPKMSNCPRKETRGILSLLCFLGLPPTTLRFLIPPSPSLATSNEGGALRGGQTIRSLFPRYGRVPPFPVHSPQLEPLGGEHSKLGVEIPATPSKPSITSVAPDGPSAFPRETSIQL